MIFSLSNDAFHEFTFSQVNVDIFCFFATPHSVVLPNESWHLAVSASLRLKREVLILEEPLKHLPELIKTQRWQIGENFLWLAPRSLSVFFEASNEILISYRSLKSALLLSK